MLLLLLVVGVVLTLATEPSLVTRPTRAQAGYDGGPSGIGSDTVPPRGLLITGSTQAGSNLLLLVGVLAGVAILGGATFVARNRHS